MEEGKKILSILEGMNTRFDGIDARLDRMDARLDKMDARLDKMESDIRDIKITIENDIRPAITIIAEGHENLDRKLNEAVKLNNDRLSEHEIMKLKINHIESEVIQIKERVLTIA